jgi:hypothetical protein
VHVQLCQKPIETLHIITEPSKPASMAKKKSSSTTITTTSVAQPAPSTSQSGGISKNKIKAPAAPAGIATSATTAKPKAGKNNTATASEIDDIFASKGSTSKAVNATSSKDAGAGTELADGVAITGKAAKKSKQKKRKAGELDDSNTASNEAETNTATKDVKGKGKASILESGNGESSNKTPVTVVDASTIRGLAAVSELKSKKARTDKVKDKIGALPVDSAKDKEEDELFRDSRGTSSRESTILDHALRSGLEGASIQQAADVALLVTGRKTDDGLPIYDIKELNIGLGGDTELCPFDCECCF